MPVKKAIAPSTQRAGSSLSQRGRDKSAKPVVQEWTTALNHLFDDITSWAESKRWLVAREPRELSESALGTYVASDLNIKTPGGWLIVEVKGRDVVGADGRVDIYAWPALHRMMLIRQGDKWIVKTDDGVKWPSPWSEKTFVDLAQQLTSIP